MTKKNSIDRNFVSPIDKALTAFNRTHPYSPAQQVEIEKYARIDLLRDYPIDTPKKDKDLWDLD